MIASSPGIEASQAVLPASIASGARIAQQVAGTATRDALFPHALRRAAPARGDDRCGLVSSIAVIGISRTLARLGPARLVPAMFAIAAALFGLEWWRVRRRIPRVALSQMQDEAAITIARDVVVPLPGAVKPRARTGERGSKALAAKLLRSRARA